LDFYRTRISTAECLTVVASSFVFCVFLRTKSDASFYSANDFLIIFVGVVRSPHHSKCLGTFLVTILPSQETIPSWKFLTSSRDLRKKKSEIYLQTSRFDDDYDDIKKLIHLFFLFFYCNNVIYHFCDKCIVDVLYFKNLQRNVLFRCKLQHRFMRNNRKRG
jgi:hypothetical protein